MSTSVPLPGGVWDFAGAADGLATLAGGTWQVRPRCLELAGTLHGAVEVGPLEPTAVVVSVRLGPQIIQRHTDKKPRISC